MMLPSLKFDGIKVEPTPYPCFDDAQDTDPLKTQKVEQARGWWMMNEQLICYWSCVTDQLCIAFAKFQSSQANRDACLQ